DVLDRIEILRELGLTPVWRLRARYRSGIASAALHGTKEPQLGTGPTDTARAPRRAEYDPPQAARSHEASAFEARNRTARIAMLDWASFASDVSACTACALAQTRNRTVPGVGDRRAEWLFVGEAPGAEEDARGEPFVGQAGRLLDNMLAALGMRRGKNVYIANVLKCRPPGNRTPEPSEVEACRPYLDRQIALIGPKLIIALGKSAATTLL